MGRAFVAAALVVLVFYVATSSRARHIAPGPALWRAPAPATVPFVTRSGLVISRPAAGICFDAPLLCTIDPTPALALRRPGDPASGFVVRDAESP